MYSLLIASFVSFIAAVAATRIPLSKHDDYVQLDREFQKTHPEVLSSLADTLRTFLAPKLAMSQPVEDKVANW